MNGIYINCICVDSSTVSTKIDVAALTHGDPEIEHKFQLIMLEAEVLKQEGKNVPSTQFVKQHHWQELLKLNTRTARRKYFEYLFKIEKKKENRTVCISK